MRDQEVIDMGWDAYIDGLKDSSVDIGIIIKDGSKNIEGDLTLAQLAWNLEFGALVKISKEYREKALKRGVNFGTQELIEVPSRPYMRNTFDEQVNEIVVFVDKIEVKIIEQKLDRKTGLEAIGDFHKSAIQKNMRTKGKYTPNSARTIQIKGSDNELIDTGRLVNSMSVRVNIKPSSFLGRIIQRVKRFFS